MTRLRVDDRKVDQSGTTSREPVFDLQILGSVTAANPLRRRQVLELFVGQVDRDVAMLTTAQTWQTWQAAAHALMSSAAALGARRLLKRADAAQNLTVTAWKVQRSQLEPELCELVCEARQHALQLLSSSVAR
jgi:HPt (histidine-containing phosphotransfer) domain-containing protein